MWNFLFHTWNHKNRWTCWAQNSEGTGKCGKWREKMCELWTYVSVSEDLKGLRTEKQVEVVKGVTKLLGFWLKSPAPRPSSCTSTPCHPGPCRWECCRSHSQVCYSASPAGMPTRGNVIPLAESTRYFLSALPGILTCQATWPSCPRLHLGQGPMLY